MVAHCGCVERYTSRFNWFQRSRAGSRLFHLSAVTVAKTRHAGVALQEKPKTVTILVSVLPFRYSLLARNGSTDNKVVRIHIVTETPRETATLEHCACEEGRLKAGYMEVKGTQEPMTSVVITHTFRPLKYPNRELLCKLGPVV